MQNIFSKNTFSKLTDLSVLYDLVFLLFFIFVEPRIANWLMVQMDEDEPLHNHLFNWVLLSSTIAQTLGIWLRMKSTEFYLQNNKGGGPFLGAIFLIVMHFTIFGMLMLFDPVKNLGGEGWMKFPLIILLILFTLIPTTSLILASFPGKKTIVFPESKKDLVIDFAGALMLLYSACIVTATMWTYLVGNLGTELHQQNFFVNILLLLLFYFCFLLFYLPPRYMFLISDWQYRNTWIRITIVFLPFAYSVMTGKNF